MYTNNKDEQTPIYVFIKTEENILKNEIIEKMCFSTKGFSIQY